MAKKGQKFKTRDEQLIMEIVKEKIKKGIKKNTNNMTIEELRIEVDILKKFQAFLKQQQERK